MVTKRKKSDNESLDLSRGQLNAERIVQESIIILNKEGIIQLTMRKLADTLGIRAASLYYHVKDKSELLQLIAEDICSKIHIPDPKLPWHEQLLLTMNEYRSVLMTVRDSAEILLDTVPFTPKRLYLIDTIYRIFLNAGLPPEEVQIVSAAINNYVLCFVMDEMKILNAARDHGITVEELTAYGTEMFKNLPKDQYPNAVFMSDFITRVDKDREFQYSLEIMLNGIKSRIACVKSSKID
jgi:TetR/AcrR family tetracycline transcriptional repressor